MTKVDDVKTVISMRESVPLLLIYASLPPLRLALCAVQIFLMEMTSIWDSWVAQTWLVIYLPSISLSFIHPSHAQTAPWRLESFFDVFPRLPSLHQVMPRPPFCDCNLMCHFIRASGLSCFTDLTSEGSRETRTTVAGICPSVVIFKCF